MPCDGIAVFSAKVPVDLANYDMKVLTEQVNKVLASKQLPTDWTISNDLREITGYSGNTTTNETMKETILATIQRIHGARVQQDVMNLLTRTGRLSTAQMAPNNALVMKVRL